MPNVLRVEGFTFMIYQGTVEHGPAHVHVIKAGRVVITLEPEISIREISGMDTGNVRRAVRITEAHRGFLTQAFRRLNGYS